MSTEYYKERRIEQLERDKAELLDEYKSLAFVMNDLRIVHTIDQCQKDGTLARAKQVIAKHGASLQEQKE